MSPVLDYILTGILLIILVFLYIAVPIVTGYFLYRRLWMSDRTKTFLSVSLFIAAAGVVVLVLVKMFV